MSPEAVGRARRSAETRTEQSPSVTSPGALRLTAVYTVLADMRELDEGHARRFEESEDERVSLSSLTSASAFNGLKISSARLVADIVVAALHICGMSGYRNDSPYTMGRLLRDAYGAALMVNTDRILANNAQLLLVH